ncbi:hypothetical protein [Brevibacillus brevis]|nr:hypothetical protein [Brevibacillus brevis]
MLKKGDKVVMHTCLAASIPAYQGKMWTCESDEFIAENEKPAVLLEGFQGPFTTEYLQKVNIPNEREERAMKFYELHDPYYALIKAPDKNEAIKVYTEHVADDDGTLHEEIREVDRDYALVSFSKGSTEDNEKVPIKEILDDFTKDGSAVLLISRELL